MTGKDVSLQDRYTQVDGTIHLSGTQALVRLPLAQRHADKAAGLNTAGFISGYRGSPLGGYDTALGQAKTQLRDNDIVFQPGINENLAATAVIGTQQLDFSDQKNRDGVFGLWYGKMVGFSQAIDALAHGNAAGSSAKGGMVFVSGDDHGATSSSIAMQSDVHAAALGTPVLAPASHEEIVEYGRMAFEMSRFSGSAVVLKVTADVVESSGSVDTAREKRTINIPTDFPMPKDGLNIRMRDHRLEQHARLQVKHAAAKAFAKANAINAMIIDTPEASLSIAAVGKSYTDVRQALYELGIDEAEAKRRGIRLMRIGMTWPLEENAIETLAKGSKELLVVEEMRGVVEDQAKTILYGKPDTPRVTGKHDDTGKALLPDGAHKVGVVAAAIVARLEKLHGPQPDLHAKLRQITSKVAADLTGMPSREAHFCSGCPHNSSLKLPEGSKATSGIGCHIIPHLVQGYPERRVLPSLHMGGEGAAWIGEAPFTNEKHRFQNLGDGTFQHSGSLGIRAAKAAGVNITFKILYNDAVAMTGGQAVDGGLTVNQVVDLVIAEGVSPENVVVLSEDVTRHASTLREDVTLRDRKELDAVQRDMRERKGISIIVYDQTCATEKRRRRKRGLMAQAASSVFINPAVCEGCGDCSKKSGCVSVVPNETELGRKRAIDQSNCNIDMSCMDGFCPSFVTVKGGKPQRADISKLLVGLDTSLPPDPVLPQGQDHTNILLTGIGGTGVVTIGALLGMAAHIDGKRIVSHDVTGLSQKGGGVYSHVRIGDKDSKGLWSSKIPEGRTDVLLACDDIATIAPSILPLLSPSRTASVVNADLTNVIKFVGDRDYDFKQAQVQGLIGMHTDIKRSGKTPAAHISKIITGNTLGANLFMVGYAWQRGWIPLSKASLMKAIELNGVNIKDNISVFEWGRRCAHNPKLAEELIRRADGTVKSPKEQTLDEMTALRVKLLTDYQDAAYAQRYTDLVAKVRAKEEAIGKKHLPLTRAVAEHYAKLMAYKDEYEVARLHTSPEFETQIKAQFGDKARVTYHLAPPLLSGRDPNTGEPRKMEFGPWMKYVFKGLTRMKHLRGGLFDIFSYHADRKTDVRLVREYAADIEKILGLLDENNHLTAVKLAQLPDHIRGYGHVRHKSIEAAKEAAKLLWAKLKVA